MIYLGISAKDKAAIIARHAEGRKVVVCSPRKFWFDMHGAEFIDWPQIIKYKTFYRLLQEIDANTLVVVNECLRTQNRSDLTLNCIRHYLSKTKRVVVFQWLPIIDTMNDWMTLVDFLTGSRFKGRCWCESMQSTVPISIIDRAPVFQPQPIPVREKTKTMYAKERESLFATLGAKDPHILPRKLLLIGGEDKTAACGNVPLIGRNNRFKLPDFATYKDEVISGYRTVFEPCHDVIDMADYLAITEQVAVPILTTELPVDRWYFDRYTSWSWRVRDAYAAILG